MTSHPLSNAQAILIAKNKAEEHAILCAMYKIWRLSKSTLNFEEWLQTPKEK